MIDNTLDLAIGNIPSLFSSSELEDATQQAGSVANSWNYCPHQGLGELRERISKYQPTYTTNEVLVTSGASEGINLLYFINIGGKRRKIVLPELCFPGFIELARLYRFDIKFYPVSEGVMKDPSPLLQLICENTAYVVLNSPLNPTGSLMNAHFVSEVVKKCEQEGGIVIWDTAYENMVYSEDADLGNINEVLKSPNILTLQSLGKVIGTSGIRLGYLGVKYAKLYRKLTEAKLHSAMCSSTLNQRILSYLLDLPLEERA
jgi:aspartate/methionine/tyrosine aminotransferase